MGHTILLQWSISPPPANLTDIIITRLLEHYGLAQPLRTTVNFRTYRAATPSSQSDQSTITRLLTTVTYSQPIPLIRDAAPPSTPRDDTTYLFLEDRTPAIVKSSEDIPPERLDQTLSEFINVDTPAPNGDAGIEVDGFEIIDAPPAAPVSQPQPQERPAAQRNRSSMEVPTTERVYPQSSMSRGKRGTYRMIAVRPAAAVIPLLQNLLSPLVMGLTKSARAAASTTAQTATPTPLPGTPLLITSLTFPNVSAPYPPIKITLHNLASPAATTIFIEAEYTGAPNPTMAVTVLREFLNGCIPEGIGGDRRFHEWEAGDDDGWEGIERTKRATMLLARCLREASYI